MNLSTLDAVQARKKLYEVMQQDLSFEEKADQALELGETYLGVQNGHLTRIDERIDFWEAIASTDPPDGDFPPGEVLDLQTTYCRRTIQEGSSIALDDAPEQGWADDPAFEEHGLHCYHGTPLTIDGNVFGTLCFVSEDPRAEPFTESETLFAELVARMLEHELRYTRQAAELDLQSNLIGVLSRVLRHNLRNDLNVVRGHLSLMAELSDEPLTHNQAAVEKIDKLVALANTARQIESIASSDLDRQPVELTALVENVIDRVGPNYPAASFTIDDPGEVYAEAIPTLRTALEELIENAAKHAGDSPDVTVSFETSPDTIDIHVIDNGPGLPEQEREVLLAGSESPLIHGSGLGLWLTYWIVSNHDGSIRADVTDDGTRVTVTLPRRSSLSEFSDSETLLGRFHREQDRFEAVFEESFDAIVIIDDDGRYTDVNESAADLFGVPRSDLLGRAYTEFVPDDVEVDTLWSRLIEAGQQRATVTLQRPDGTERTVEYAAVTDIVPGQHLAILRDVTERIEQQEALEETTQRLQAVVEASPEPIMALDSDGSIRHWNDAAEEAFGYEAQEVLGEPISALGLHEGEEETAFEDRFQRALEGEAFRGFEVRRRRKDGEHVHLSLSTAPIRDAEGTITGVIAVAQDITDRVERERRLEALTEGFPDLCFILDADGVYHDVLKSPASEEYLYVEPDAMLGQQIEEVLPAEQATLLRQTLEETLDTSEKRMCRFMLDVPAGRLVFENRLYPLAKRHDGKQLVSLVVREIPDLPGGDMAEEPATG